MTGRIFVSQKIITFFILIISCLVLCGCRQGGAQYRKLSKEDSKNIKYKGHYKVGSEYTIKNTTYKPKEVKSYTQVGMASWYGKKNGFHGKKTANGDYTQFVTVDAIDEMSCFGRFINDKWCFATASQRNCCNLRISQ